MFSLTCSRIGAARLLVAFLGTGCAVAPGAQGQQPEGGPFKIDSVSSAWLRAHLRTLRFAVDSEAGDRQALLLGRYPDARLGPLATILPELQACMMPPDSFEQGRVIARIDNESAETYPRLGLLPHTSTYLLVQYLRATERADSRLITVDADTTIVGRTVLGLEIISYHTDFRPTQPQARFVWTATGELPWACCFGRCCKTREVPK